MKHVQQVELDPQSKEEQLPGFTSDFPYIATCAELDHYMEPIVPWHWHRTVELFYMKSGCLQYTTPSGTWIFPEGSGGFVNSNVLHSSKILPTGSSTIQLLHLFDPIFLSGETGSRIDKTYIMPLTGSSAIEVLPLCPDHPEHLPILDDILRAFELSPQDWGYEFALRETLGKIWLKLFDLVRPLAAQNQHSDHSDLQIKAMLVYIQEHYSEQISVEQLAEVASISKRACFRLFQDTLHTTPLEYIRSYRLQKARQLLIGSHRSVTQIAVDCGVGSGSYFGKVFRERFGCTPTQYRANWHDRDNFGRV